jgi:hypothetical protein
MKKRGAGATKSRESLRAVPCELSAPRAGHDGRAGSLGRLERCSGEVLLRG